MKWHDRSKWFNSVPSHLLVSSLVWLPATTLLFWIAYRSGSITSYLFSSSLSLLYGLFLLHGVQTSVVFPAIEVSDDFLIVNTGKNRRSVYDLDRIAGARFFRHILYFRHNKWPVIVQLSRMPKKTRQELLIAITSSN